MHIYSHIPRDDLIIVVARYNEDITKFLPFNNNLMVYNKGNNNINSSINKEYIIKCPNLGREAGTYIKHIIENYDSLSEYTIFTQGNPCHHISMNNFEVTFKKFDKIFNEKKDYKFKYISEHTEQVTLDTLVAWGSGIPVTPIELGDPKDINELIEEVKLWVENNCPDEVCINPNNIPQDNPGNGIIRELTTMLNKDIKTIFPWEFTEICIKDFWYLTSSSGQKMRIDLTLNFNYDKILPLLDRPEGLSFGYGAIFIVHKTQILRYSKDYWLRLYKSLQEILPGAGLGCEKLWGFLMD
jgi:hypothetical protein